MSRSLPVFVLAGMVAGGVVAYLMGSPLLIGVAVGLVLGFSPIAALAAAHFFFMVWRPDWPACKCGQAASGHYDYLGMERRSAGNVYAYRCPACGREYRQTRLQFRQYKSDGSEVPYMRISIWGRWVADDAGSIHSADASEMRR